MTTEVKTDNLMLPKMGVAELILYTLVTIGIYQAVWFIKRLETLNALKSEFKFSQGPFGFVIAGCIANAALAVYLAFFGKGADQALIANLTSVSDAVVIALQVVMLFQCLKVRRVIMDHLGEEAAEEAKFSWLWTILFGLFYVQYKINRLDMEVRREA